LSDCALYLLAPPSVPQEALDETAKRLEAGEKVSVATVAKIIVRAKGATEGDADNSAVLIPPAAETGASAAAEESIKQRRQEHTALFGEPAAKIDQHDPGGADDNHNGENRGNGDAGNAAPKSAEPKPRKQSTHFERTLFSSHARCTNSDDMVIPELTAQKRDEALSKLAECMGALQIIAGKIGGPKAETLIDHWRRSPGELTALLDTVTVPGVLGAMSAEFGRDLRDRVPNGKPYRHTLNLSARDGRDHRFRH
jgi:hypothetical protein